jgi:hypothetical protein
MKSELVLQRLRKVALPGAPFAVTPKAPFARASAAPTTPSKTSKIFDSVRTDPDSFVEIVESSVERFECLILKWKLAIRRKTAVDIIVERA